MEIIRDTVTFPQHSGSGPETTTRTLTFHGTVQSAVAALTGYDVKFSPVDGDHHLGRLEVAVNTTGVFGHQVQVAVTFGLRDWSGNWDDRFEGVINYAVLANVA